MIRSNPSRLRRPQVGAQLLRAWDLYIRKQKPPIITESYGSDLTPSSTSSTPQTYLLSIRMSAPGLSPHFYPIPLLEAAHEYFKTSDEGLFRHCEKPRRLVAELNFMAENRSGKYKPGPDYDESKQL